MEKRILNPENTTLILFTGVLIAIFCAPGLHPQFETWYVFTIPFLAHSCKYEYPIVMLIVVVVDITWRFSELPKAIDQILAYAGFIINVTLIYRLWHVADHSQKYIDQKKGKTE